MARTRTTNRQTPWGLSDRAEILADGITWYSTPSHGGYHLSPERMRQLRAKFPEYKLFAGAPWFEEDCDCVLVHLAFPELYDRQNIGLSIQAARHFLKTFGMTWAEIVRHIDQDPELSAIEREFKELAKTHWQNGGGGSIPRDFPEQYRRGWRIQLRRGAELRNLIAPDYPDRDFYTDADIADWPDFETIRAQVAAQKEREQAARQIADYGGAFDGFTVTSDADAGL